MEDGDLGFMSIFLVLATMLDWEQRLERLRALISAAVVQARLGVKRGIDTNCRAATRRRLQQDEMHQGEREIIFAHPLSSKAKCLTHLPSLLEHIFLMHSDLRDVNFLLHSVVEVGLRSRKGKHVIIST
jgi:hypothetical protein